MVEPDQIFEAALGQMDRVDVQVKEVFSATLDECRRTGRPLDAEGVKELLGNVERLGRESEAYGDIARRNWFFRAAALFYA